MLITIRLMRHGHTEGKERTLSKEGKKAAASKKFAADMVLSSDKERTIQTARIVSGKEPTILPCLYLPEGKDGELINRAYEKLGDISLRGYLISNVPGIGAACLRYSNNAATTILGEIKKAKKKPKKILVVGHGVLISAVAIGLLAQFGAQGDLAEKIFDATVGPASGFEISVEENGHINVSQA